MTIKGKAFKVLSWALGAVLVASVAWAAVGWRVDDYGNIKSARSTVLLSAGQTSNCKLSISGSTLSVVGLDGNALSASNPCRVGLNDGTIASFTSPVSVTFGASSDTDGNLFGISEANWANALTMKLGVITDGSNSYFTISRPPLYVSDSSSSNLCQKGDTNCDAQGSAMILTTGLTLSNWISKPITQVGYFDATYATSGYSWTFSTPAPAGFNFEYKKLKRVFPTGQMGAATGKFFDSANAPTWASPNLIVYQYQEDTDGHVVVEFYTDQAGNCTNGSDGNVLYLVFPFVTNEQAGAAGFVFYGAANNFVVSLLSAGTSKSLIASNSSYLVNNGFSNTSDDFFMKFIIRSM